MAQRSIRHPLQKIERQPDDEGQNFSILDADRFMGGSAPVWLGASREQFGISRSLAFRAAAPTCAKSGACPNTWGSTDIERQFSAHGRIAERFVSSPNNAAGGATTKRPRALDPCAGRAVGPQE